MKLCISWVILCFLISNCSGFNPNKQLPPLIEGTEAEAFIKWKTIENGMKTSVDDLFKQLIPKLMDSNDDVDIDPDCFSDLLKIVFDLKKLKLWAVKVLDAMGKPGGGQTSGTSAALGDYDLCLNIEFPQSAGEIQAKGQYCMLDISMPLPPKPRPIVFMESAFKNSTFETEFIEFMKMMTFGMYGNGFRLGVCVPSTCSRTDIQNMASAAGKQVNSNIRVYSCETKQSFALDTTQMAIVGILLALLGIVLLSSIADYFLEQAQSPSIGRELVSAFSFNRNIRKTFVVKDPEGSRLQCMNGLRVISIVWLVLGHTYCMLDPYLIGRAMNIDHLRREFLLMAVVNGFPLVQTFYVIMGALLSYNTVQAFDSKGIEILNVPLMIVRRIWRLLPSMMLVVAFGIMFPVLGSGPNFQDTASFFSSNCEDRWWTHVLFINNFWGSKQACFPHTWYVASDMQLFIIAIIYFYLLFKKPVFGNVFLVFLAVLSVVSTACVTYFFKLPALVLMSIPDIDYFDMFSQYIYLSSYPQLATLAVALGLGTFMARTDKLKLSKTTVIIGWCVAFTMGMAIVYGVFPWQSSPPSEIESILHGSLYRVGWALCVAWVVLACDYGYSGFVNSFLSWGAFQPMVRISYLIYLLHLPIVVYYIACLQAPLDVRHSCLVWLFMGNLGLSLVASVGVRVLFEAPICELDRIFMKVLKGGFRKQKQEDNNEFSTLENKQKITQLGIENGSYATDETTPKND